MKWDPKNTEEDPVAKAEREYYQAKQTLLLRFVEQQTRAPGLNPGNPDDLLKFFGFGLGAILPKSITESMMSRYGGSGEPEPESLPTSEEMTLRKALRQKQVDQYLNPNEDILPLTSSRPTALRNADNTQTWRSIKPFLGDTLTMVTDPPVFLDKDLPKKTRAFFYPDPALGRYTQSIGKDTLGHYLSIYDSWDFKSGPGHASGGDDLDTFGHAWATGAGGKGFNVYDRFYFTPDTVEGRLKLPKHIPVGK